MKPVIIDRGIYRLGMKHDNGENTKPSWESNLDGGSLIIGHKDEQFQISYANDIEFIFRELSKRLNIDLYTRLIETEMYYDEMAWECEQCNEVWTYPAGNPKDNRYNYCPQCGRRITEYIKHTEDLANKEGVE